MDIDAKLRPLYLIQILKERTDEDNYLTTSQLCDILKKKYMTNYFYTPYFVMFIVGIINVFALLIFDLFIYFLDSGIEGIIYNFKKF